MTMSENKWTAIILAGQRPGIDPLSRHFGLTWKALIPVDGEAMLTRVVRSVSNVPAIGKIIVLGQEPGALQAAVDAGGAAMILTSTTGISESIQRIAGSAAAPWPIFVTTADHPLLTPEIIGAFLRGSTTTDLSVGMVERAVLLANYPGNKRTWLKFSDGHWSGANLFALRGEKVRAALNLWAEAEKDRKQAWKLFLHFGPWLMVRALTRTIGLNQAFTRAGKRLGLTASLVAMDSAEAAIDVDKLSDHALASDILARRRLK
jgi:GTP:adenosylcobinamide-phosphate guanylyltransferase